MVLHKCYVTPFARKITLDVLPSVERSIVIYYGNLSWMYANFRDTFWAFLIYPSFHGAYHFEVSKTNPKKCWPIELEFNVFPPLKAA